VVRTSTPPSYGRRRVGRTAERSTPFRFDKYVCLSTPICPFLCLIFHWHKLVVDRNCTSSLNYYPLQVFIREPKQGRALPGIHHPSIKKKTPTSLRLRYHPSLVSVPPSGYHPHSITLMLSSRFPLSLVLRAVSASLSNNVLLETVPYTYTNALLFRVMTSTSRSCPPRRHNQTSHCAAYLTCP